MFGLELFCNDNGCMYLGKDTCIYNSHDAALVAAYRSAINEATELMKCSNSTMWFEVCIDFEVTDTYASDILELGTIFPVAVLCYDHAPWDRENDCDIKIVTGYTITNYGTE